jgi:5-hydroxyisourate hydrolase
MSTITSHILDIAKGCTAAGVVTILFIQKDDAWLELHRTTTNTDGRIAPWTVATGRYKLRFETRAYFDLQPVPTFYPFIEIHFDIGSDAHYHVPLLLSPWGYSTYRGS